MMAVDVPTKTSRRVAGSRKRERVGRTVDTLKALERAGIIDSAMATAGRRFAQAFHRAALDPLRAIAIDEPRVDGGDRSVPHAIERARQRVRRELDVLGGPESPAGSILWHVIGCQRSVQEWAVREGWNGRPVRREVARGILVGALSALAAVKNFYQKEIDT